MVKRTKVTSLIDLNINENIDASISMGFRIKLKDIEKIGNILMLPIDNMTADVLADGFERLAAMLREA